MPDTLSYRPKHAGPVPPPALVAAAGWAIPGLGYWLIGERGRAIVAGVTILVLFVLGLLIGGIRVVDVPGYTGNGYAVGADPAVTRRPVQPRSLVQLTFEKAWYIPQMLTGPVTIAASYGSIQAAQSGAARATARLWDIGTLYTAVAGMLNLFVLIDAAYRAARSRDKDPRLQRM